MAPIDLSFDDEARFAAVAGPLADADGTVDAAAVGALFAGVGVAVAPEAMSSWWEQTSTQLFGEVAPRRPLSEAYRMLRTAGWGGKALDPAERRPTWVPLWWNQVRMGGRDPSELAAPIGVPDAAAAIGLAGGADAEAVAALDALEATHGISVPAELRALATRVGFEQAFRDAHCNNPEWQPPGQWEVVRDLRTAGLAGEVGLVVALPHQGEHAWMVVFDSGDPTGTVYTRHPTGQGPLCLPTAPSLAHWLWDLAETGRDWARGIAAPRSPAEGAAPPVPSPE